MTHAKPVAGGSVSHPRRWSWRGRSPSAATADLARAGSWGGPARSDLHDPARAGSWGAGTASGQTSGMTTPDDAVHHAAPDADAAPVTHADADAHRHPPGVRPGQAEWDARYDEQDLVWSGEPNHALVVEAATLAPGRALDVGCGEGADAVWLASRGWAVVGLDPSAVALDRARAAASAAGADVTWVHAELADGEAGFADGAFDLVTAFYPTLYTDTDPLVTLTRLVAPGGSLLVVHHADVDPDRAREHGFDPADLLSPADVATGVGDGWTVAVDERRPRVIRGGSGAHHHDDLVVRVVRHP